MRTGSCLEFFFLYSRVCSKRRANSIALISNSNDIGVFASLTNSYCITALGGSENFYRFRTSFFSSTNMVGLVKLANISVFQSELASDIPVVKTSIAGTRLVGRMSVGRYQRLPSRSISISNQ